MKVDNISRFKKERFLKGLSEDNFRDKVVRPLLLRLGFTDGRDLCGPNEHGKDSVFGEVDKLGFNTILAVQTKKGSLNLASKATNNLIEAITQLKTALDTSVILLLPKAKVRPNKAILCASGKVNLAAREHIIDEVKNPNIQFLDSDDLIPLIDKHFPELWLGIDTDMLPYLRTVIARITGSSEIGIGPDGHDGIFAGATDDSVFVGLSLFRRVKKSKKIRGHIYEIPGTEEFPLTSIVNKKNRRVLIVGEAGAGKSTGLMRITLEIARMGIEADSKYRIPIFMKSVDIWRSKPSNILSYCDQITKELSGSSKSCFTVEDLNQGSVILLIDAIDELASDLDRRYVLNLISDFTQQYPKCQIIITARPYRFTVELNVLKSFDEFNISPINWKQAEKILHAVTAHRQVPKRQSQELLRQLEKIHGIELNPLLVTVFAATTDFTKQDLPANITELFKKFTELMLGRWDEKKGFKHQYQAPLKDFVLTRIAFSLHNSKVTSISRVEAEAIAKNELKKRGHDANVGDMLSEIFDRSGLFRIVGSEIEFKHHLLQEFFAGRGIDSPEFIKTSLTDEWWRRALVFYFGENPEQIELLKTSIDALSGAKPPALLAAATAAGLALQACYLSPVAKKLEVWKWVASALSVAQDSFIKDVDPKNQAPLLAFFHYYFYSRDSVSLSHLKSFVNTLSDWSKTTENLCQNGNDWTQFWLIVGLIESGELEEAGKLVKKFAPENGKLVTAIHLGCHLALEIKPLSPQEKKSAKDICNRLEDKVAPYLKQILSEYGSTLLELRNGEIKGLDNEIDEKIISTGV